MRLCLLRASYEGTTSDFSNVDPPMDPRPWLAGHEVDVALLQKRTAKEQIEKLAAGGYDAFINLCDGSADEETAGIEVVRELERLKLPFTGARSDFYEPTRMQMKQACARANLPTPAFATNLEDARRLKYPLFVKHPNSYGSIGLHKGSRVDDEEALQREVQRISDHYGSALIEQYIDGREYAVLVVENPDDPRAPIALRPIEFVFPEGESFKHFALKWVDWKGASSKITYDAALDANLAYLAKRFFLEMNGSGYARCDLRVDRAGNPFLLEINPNCAVFYALDQMGMADEILTVDPLGHAGFLDLLLRTARRRAG